MALIKNTKVYPKVPKAKLNDSVIGTQTETGKTFNFELIAIRELLLEGLAPEVGGTLKIDEIVYSGILTTPQEVLNSLNPIYNVLQYHVLIVNVNGNKYQFKKQDVVVGFTATPTQANDFIAISLVAEKLSSDISFYKGLNVTSGKEEHYSIGSIGFSIQKETDNLGVETGKIILEQKQQSSKGGGELIYLGLNPITKLQEFTTLGTNTLVFTKEIINNVETGKLLIDTPQDLSVKSFYVNEAYQGDSNGNISKPYKKLVDALIAMIGTGTLAIPQFQGAKIILQSSVTVTQQDLNNNPILENKLSVNGMTILSDLGRRQILFKGTTDYPVDTEFLINKVGFDANLKLKNNVAIFLENIDVTTDSVFGIVKQKGYYTDALYSPQNISIIQGKNVNFSCFYFPTNSYFNLKDSAGNNIMNFGSIAKGQSTIPNTTPHIHSIGKNADNGSGLTLENSSIIGTSQTVLKIEDGIIINQGGKISVSRDSRYLNVQTQTTNGVYLPKEDVNLIEIVNSEFARLVGLTEENQFPYNNLDNAQVGGDNAIIKLANSNLKLENYYNYGSHHCNYFIQMDELSNISNTTGILQNIPIRFSHLKAIAPFTTPKKVNFEGSNGYKFNDPNFSLIATDAKVNGFNFSSTQGFANDAQALLAGLIVGNIYYNTTSNSLKKII